MKRMTTGELKDQYENVCGDTAAKPQPRLAGQKNRLAICKPTKKADCPNESANARSQWPTMLICESVRHDRSPEQIESADEQTCLVEDTTSRPTFAAGRHAVVEEPTRAKR